MKTKNNLFLILFLLAFGLSVQAKKVEQKDAEKVAVNYIYEKLNKYERTVNYNDIIIKDIYVHTSEGEPMFYAFDMEGGGFVIVSADDATYPVIGYSYEGEFPVNAMGPTNYGSFMQSYVNEVQFVRDNQMSADAYIAENWNHYSTEDINTLNTQRDGRDVEPLLSSLWNQDSPYNLDCPKDPAGPGGHVYAGCVATAMAMVMHYWRYPEMGEGSHSYYASGYGTQSANFGETTYNWDGMMDEIMNVYPHDMSLIQYHCGVSVDMGYSPNGSGAHSSDADDALRNYFKYGSAIFREKSNYSHSNWVDLLKGDLDQGRPIYYSGYTPQWAGHAFGCDGYQGSNFHFNFGWSGSGNGYYSLYDVNGYYVGQGCIKNFYPTEDEYPYYASGLKELTTLAGSFTDGSGPIEDYQENQSAQWHINPQTITDSVTKVQMKVMDFALEANDTFVIYDGDDASAPVLLSCSGANPPALDSTINSTGNSLYIEFESDGSGTDAGFYVEYWATVPSYCSGLVKYEEPTGELSDGSGDFDYSNNSGCMFSIEPEYASNITLYFDEFETEEGVDKVKVYDGTTNLIGTFSGSELPDEITATSGQMFIIFNSNAWVNAPGWKAHYTIDNVGMNENAGFEALAIYPNPANDQINIRFKNEDMESFSINLMSITGKTVYRNEYNEMRDYARTSIDVSNLPKGVYILQIQGESKAVTKKVVIE